MSEAAAATISAPSVLAVVIARNGEPWLRGCLAGLAQQEYPRLGVVGVDLDSTDASRELLVSALGSDRVLSVDGGLAEVIEAVQRRDGAADIDYLLLMHDDTALQPEAVLRLVQAASTTEDAGVVGPKLVDWDDPRILRDIGWSADRFGHPYSPLEPGELDQGQHDRISEVLFVSSAAMLISQEGLTRAGLPDARLGMESAELDLCWRIRLAGFHVLASPLAVARHRDAGARGERTGDRTAARRRYLEERSAGVALFKNYGLGSVWVIPLYFLLGVVKLLMLLVARRFGEIGQILAAWGWNIVHFPGTVMRRVKIQAARRVRDREIHRYMTHGSVRLRRWLDAAGRFLPGEVDLPEDEEGFPQETLRERASTAARGHPVAAAWVLALALAVLAFRPVVTAGTLTGGWLPATLPPPGATLTELGSGFRTTGLGGIQPASPALGVFGGLEALPFVDMDLVVTFLLCLLPFAAGVSAYRFAFRLTAHRTASLVASASYVLSALFMWSFSNGRIPTLVTLAVLPKIAERLDMAFDPGGVSRRARFVVGTGVFLAVGIAFWPGLALAAGVLAACSALTPTKARRIPAGILLTLGIGLVGVALSFPVAIDVADSAGSDLASLVGVPDIAILSRIAIAPGTGVWPVAWFFPIAAGLGLMLAGREHRRASIRAALAVAAGLGLAWASAAGWLPATVSNPSAYMAAAAVGCLALVGIGAASAATMPRGVTVRWLTAMGMVVVVATGLLLQSAWAALGMWDIGEAKLPAAWPLIDAGGPAEERILWLGHPDGLPFGTPGGDPTHVWEAGTDTAAYAITDRTGVSLLDVGRTSWGPGYKGLEAALSEMRTRATIHGGALLGPLGIRYVVAEDGGVPRSLLDLLERQVDLDRVPAGGLIIFRNAAAWPVASVVQGKDISEAIEGGDPLSVAVTKAAEETQPLTPVEAGWDGSGEGAAWVADQYDHRWRLSAGAGSAPARLTSGWAMSFRALGGDLQIRFGGQGAHTAQMWLLAVLWAATLWVTRKPVRR